MKKLIKLFTHTDLDGVGCAMLAKLAFGEEVDISYCNYDDINENIMNYLNNNDDSLSYIYITDISVNEEVAKLLDKRIGVVLLDHHPTALGLNKYPWCKVMVEDLNGVKTSGTKMFYHWLSMNGCLNEQLETNEALSRFAELVRNYDTWRWSELGEDGVICKQVNDLMYLYGRDRFITWCISEIHDDVFPRLYSADELLLNTKQKEIDEYVEEKNEQLFTSPMCGRVCGFVFAEKYVSELGNRLCKMHPEIDYVAMIDMGSKTVSYRTVKDDIDLGKDVAQLFGGGGHPKAAGSEFSVDVQFKTIEKIFS